MDAQQTQANFQEIWTLFRETVKALKGAEKMVGPLGSRSGEFVEGMVKASMQRMFRDRGINIEQVHQRSS